jgi:hypothetical protein
VVVVVVVGGTVVVVVVVVVAAVVGTTFFPLGGVVVVVVVVGGGAGGFTMKSVPVITVIWALDEVDGALEVVGWEPDELGASAMMTWPEIERATACAAASSAGVSCAYSTTVSACSPTGEVVETPTTSKPRAWRAVSAVWPAE